MGDVIAVDWKERKKIEKYTVHRHQCVMCFSLIVFDSRREYNEPYLEYPGPSKTTHLCKHCALAVHDSVIELGWNKEENKDAD